MRTARIIFPHQLFLDPGLEPQEQLVVLLEEELFFSQYRFHQRKLAFHRATMQYYRDVLARQGCQVRYVAAHDPVADVRRLVRHLAKADGVRLLRYEDPVDDWLSSRLEAACRSAGIATERRTSRLFLNSDAELATWFEGRRTFRQADFYTQQRKLRHILVDGAGNPLHGQWSFDAANRLRYPKNKKPPALAGAATLAWHTEAAEYVRAHFASNPGSVTGGWQYPVTHAQADAWLEDFLHHRFSGFGDYEDALVEQEAVLHHSVLSPLLNCGLLQPQQVIDRAVAYARRHRVAYNNLEGFVRQVLGWREFVRGVYLWAGRRQRSHNFWGFHRAMPAAFYSGTTGVRPVDAVISKLLRTGYNHHIERLMVLGNFMLLCEIDPTAVYRWFMELYIDAYDWVMVPNVYGMSQFADGGLMCSKPYLSGSNYLRKMSDFPPDPTWSDLWDALFWRFMATHRQELTRNPRLAMLLKTLDRMAPAKRTGLIKRAEQFLDKL